MLKLNFISSLFVSLLLVCANLARGQVAATPAEEIYDDFESPELGKLWDTSRFVPGAVQIQSAVFRQGHRAAKITVQAQEKFEAGINGNLDSERAELMEAKKLTSKENLNYEQSFSMFIPTNFPIVPTRLVIAQWKQYCSTGGNCSDDSPVLALRYIGGVLKISQNINSIHEIFLYQQTNEFRGRWLDFKFQTRFSTTDNGRIKAWLDDEQVVDFKGVTANVESTASGYPSPSRFYFKMGLYRDVMAEPMTIYIDDYRKKGLAADAF